LQRKRSRVCPYVEQPGFGSGYPKLVPQPRFLSTHVSVGFYASAHHLAFWQRLRELGYVEGQNFVIEYRCAESKPERRPEMAAELVRLKVDVIVTPGVTPLIRAAKQATSTIPIVMSGISADPIKAGFVQSLARPGGNITGLTNFETELHPKRLELLKETFPQISRVAIIWHWHKNQQKHGLKETEAVGQALGIQIQTLVVRRRDTLESVFSAISQESPDALLVAGSYFALRHRARIIEFVAHSSRARGAGRGLPTIYSSNRIVREGGLMSYGTDRNHIVRRAATYVAKILKGAKPGDLPIEQPTKFKLITNLKTAKKLGLTIPPEVLMRATKVIK